MDVIEASWMEAFIGTIGGSMGETSVVACLIGAAVLIATGIGSWRVMASALVGGAGTAWLLVGTGSETNAMLVLPHEENATGAKMIAAELEELLRINIVAVGRRASKRVHQN